jgi:hypothetical protein
LVALAPAIPGWSIISLEDPLSADPELEELLSASGISVEDLYFSFGSDLGNLDIANLSEANDKQLWKLEELPSRIITRGSLYIVNEAGVLKQVGGRGDG